MLKALDELTVVTAQSSSAALSSGRIGLSAESREASVASHVTPPAEGINIGSHVVGRVMVNVVQVGGYVATVKARILKQVAKLLLCSGTPTIRANLAAAPLWVSLATKRRANTLPTLRALKEAEQAKAGRISSAQSFPAGGAHCHLTW